MLPARHLIAFDLCGRWEQDRRGGGGGEGRRTAATCSTAICQNKCIRLPTERPRAKIPPSIRLFSTSGCRDRPGDLGGEELGLHSGQAASWKCCSATNKPIACTHTHTCCRFSVASQHNVHVEAPKITPAIYVGLFWLDAEPGLFSFFLVPSGDILDYM